MSAFGPKVILRHCDEYDPDRIRTIIGQGLDELGLRPTGRVLVKPNLVIALPGLFDHAFTRPELLDGLLGALKERADEGIEEIAVGERCGITMPTRLAYEGAGYPRVEAKHNVKRYFFDEVTQVPVRLGHPDRLRDIIYAPEPVVKADFFVNVPKFKAHPWTTVTFGAKNYIGLQDDRHRLIDHDHRLDEKIADLQELVQPKFLCVDAIIAGHERMMTPPPFPLNLIIMGNNQPALDAVCCQILGLDPREIPHIRLCADRGYGPIDLGAIELSGDVSLSEARQRAQGFKVGLTRVEDYFEDSPITALAGPPPEPEHSDYCWGGCPGAIEEAVEIIRQIQPDAYDSMRPMTLVFGAYDGPIEPRDGEKVVFMGDCCRWKGRLGGTEVTIPSCYVDRQRINPCNARMTDIFVKMWGVYRAIFAARGEPYLRITGCPVSVAEQVLVMATLGRTQNPYFAPATVFPFLRGWLAWRWARIERWLLGKPYQADRLPVPAKATGQLEAAGQSTDQDS
jgi:uncharacterized protein (DUF362 family)